MQRALPRNLQNAPVDQMGVVICDRGYIKNYATCVLETAIEQPH